MKTTKLTDTVWRFTYPPHDPARAWPVGHVLFKGWTVVARTERAGQVVGYLVERDRYGRVPSIDELIEYLETEAEHQIELQAFERQVLL